MKLHSVLTVGGRRYLLSQADTRLTLSGPGRAGYSVQADAPPAGLVTLDIGYDDARLTRFFTGYIERCTQAGAGVYSLFCRELCAVLAAPVPLNLRHCTPAEVLGAVAEQTGLSFRLPAAPYASKTAPFFYELGSGYHLLDSIGDVYAIADYLWTQEGDGAVYVGSWADSFWSGREPLPLPAEFLTDYQSSGGATLPCIPGLRPGAHIEGGRRLTSVYLINDQMTLKWTAQ